MNKKIFAGLLAVVVLVGGGYYWLKNNPKIITSKDVLPTVGITSLTELSDTSVSLTGRINTNGYSTSFWYEYGKSINLGKTTDHSTAIFSDGVGTPIVISSLESFTKYYFRLNAQNQFGTAHGDILDFTTKPKIDPLTSGVPTITTNQATNIMSSSAQLNANINPNGATQIYWFEYSGDASLCDAKGCDGNGLYNSVYKTDDQKIDAGTKTISVNVSIKNLVKNTTYFYALFSTNPATNGGTRVGVEGNIMSFTTKP